jgi:tetratricopeptide (TPR) repeat protein
VLFRQGHFVESVETARRAVRAADAAGEKASLAHALSVLDGSLTQVGRVDPAVTERALALYEELDDVKGLGATLNHLGIHAYYEGRWSEALDFYKRSHEAKERSGDVEGSAMALHNEAEILCDQGHYEEADALFRDALRVAKAAGHPLIEAFVTANLGRLEARRLCFEQAHELLDEASEKLAAIGSGNMVLETDVRRAECLVLEGRHREALELSGRALARAGELGRLASLGPSLERTLGYALRQERRAGESLPHFEESLRLAREAQAEYEVALTLRALAETSGNGSRDADEVFERLGVVATPRVPLP